MTDQNNVRYVVVKEGLSPSWQVGEMSPDGEVTIVFSLMRRSRHDISGVKESEETLARWVVLLLNEAVDAGRCPEDVLESLKGEPGTSQPPSVGWHSNEVVKGEWYPDMPPMLRDENLDHYTNRLVGVFGEEWVPYDHPRNRQCSLGWHRECSQKGVEGRCRCPHHQDQAELEAVEVGG